MLLVQVQLQLRLHLVIEDGRSVRRLEGDVLDVDLLDGESGAGGGIDRRSGAVGDLFGHFQ